MRRLTGGALAVMMLAALSVFSQTADFQQDERDLAEGRYAEAEQMYQSLRQRNPAVAEVHARLGLTLFQERKFEQAAPELRQAMKLKPGLPNTDVLLAMSLSELGRYSEALPGLEKGFRRSSDPVLKRMAGLQLERAYTGLQRDRNAVEVAMELAKSYPDDPEVLYHASRLFGNFAYVTLLKLAAVAPDSAWRHQAAGEAQESQEQYDLAILEYRKVLERDPRRIGIHYRIGRSILARAVKENAQSEAAGEAAREFQNELQLDPTNANAAYEWGELDRKLAKYAEARELFTAAVNYDPQFEEAEIGLGRTLLAMAQAELALPHLKRAIALNAQNEVTYYQLAQAYQRLGDAAAQRKALEEFRRLRSRRAAQKVEAAPPGPVTKQQLDAEP